MEFKAYRRGSTRQMLFGAVSLAAVATAAAGPALAQSAPSGAPAGGAEVSEVLVTASRVQQTGFEAPTPTTVLGADDIRKTGITMVGQLTTQMPQFLGTDSPSNSGVRSGGGASAFNLRGLGAPRTLFLVNSRRHVPNNPNGTTDNNVVPSSIIDRVEVVTGGASAAWGSDAVAGVVNVILKKEIDGLEISAQAGGTEHGDNQEIKTSAAWGRRFADGRGKFMIAGEYDDNKGILHQSDRDWGRRGWSVIANPAYTSTNGQYAQLLTANGVTNNGNFGGVIVSGVLAGTTFGPGGTPIPYNSGAFPVGASGSIGGDGPDLNRGLAVLVPIQRYSIYTRTSYDLTDKVSLFFEGTLAQSKTNYGLVDNFHFGNITINSDNAFLAPSLRTALAAAGQTSFKMGRVDSDFGVITEHNANATRRAVVGLEGAFGHGWTWNGYYQFGDNRETLDEGPIVKPANYALAADAVVGPIGQIVCRSSLTNPTNGCVPINLFGSGSPSAAAIAYVTGFGHKLTIYQQQVASFSLQGPLFNTWAGPVSVATGAEYRRDNLNRTVDALSQANAYLIGNPKAAKGEVSVKEAFAEAVVPLAKDAPLIKSLDLDLADRYVDYSTTGTVNTWKVGLNYAVTDELRFRATRSRDIRAPNASELFLFGGTQFASIKDTVTGRLANQVELINSPNPSLQPEEADTTTFGVVYEPSWLPRFRVSIDHYKIDIAGAIVSIPAQDIVDRCAAGNQALCGALTRNAAGDIIRIQAGRVNLSHLITSGVDGEAAYSLPVWSMLPNQSANLSLRALVNYVKENISDDGRTRIDRAGQVFDTGAVPSAVPHWRANGMIVYDTGPLSLIANLRYVGGGVYNTTFKPTDLNVQRFSARTYLNLGFNYALSRSSGEPIQIFGQVNNVFDRDPPIIPDSHPQSLITNYTLYDTIGRTFMIGFRMKY